MTILGQFAALTSLFLVATVGWAVLLVAIVIPLHTGCRSRRSHGRARSPVAPAKDHR